MARSAILLLLAVFCLTTATETDQFLQMLKDRSATRYCGSNLSDVLSVVCKGRYNTPPPFHDLRKREITKRELELSHNTFFFSFMSKNIPERFMARHKFRRRYRRGVYNECCENPCSYEVLLSYCA